MMMVVNYESYYYNKCGNLSDESSLGADAELKCLPDSRYDGGLNANVFTLWAPPKSSGFVARFYLIHATVSYFQYKQFNQITD